MGKTPVYRFAKKFKGLVPETRSLFQNVLGEEDDLEAKEFQLDEWLDEVGAEPSDKEIKHALKISDSIEKEVQDSLQSIEKGIQNISKMIGLVQQAEQAVGQEEYYSRIMLQDLNREINGIEGGLDEEEAGQVVNSLLEVSQRLGQEAEDMRTLCLMAAELERDEEKGFEAEEYLKNEIEEFEEQLSALRQLIAESGTNKQKKFEQKLQRIGQKIERILRTELNQVAQEKGASDIAVSQLEEQVNEFSEEIQTLQSQIEKVRKHIRNSGIYDAEEENIEKAEENIEEALDIVKDAVERMRDRQA